jgi:hypothetical protein
MPWSAPVQTPSQRLNCSTYALDGFHGHGEGCLRGAERVVVRTAGGGCGSRDRMRLRLRLSKLVGCRRCQGFGKDPCVGSAALSGARRHSFIQAQQLSQHSRPHLARKNSDSAHTRHFCTHDTSRHHARIGCERLALPYTTLYDNFTRDGFMPGLVTTPNTARPGAAAGMKRAHVAEETVPTYGEAHPKKRRVLHQLHHTQPIQYIADPVSAEHDPSGQSKDFFDHQLRRAIAIQCTAAGFDGARPEAMEKFRGLADSCGLHCATACALCTDSG